MPRFIWEEPVRGGYPGSALFGLSGLERLILPGRPFPDQRDFAKEFPSAAS
jgi:hypothetical protein